MLRKRTSFVLVLLVLTSLVMGAYQPVRPVVQAVAAHGSITGDLDFAVPDWGLQHGWFHFNVLTAKKDGVAPTGWVRWVEVNANQELRYVMADAKCVTFSKDGKNALLTVQISSRRGWGDGQAGQWLNLWLHDGGSPGANNDAFATPFWPPQDTNPGCTYVEPETNIITAVGGDLEIRR